jgi:hypothetical protein
VASLPGRLFSVRVIGTEPLHDAELWEFGLQVTDQAFALGDPLPANFGIRPPNFRYGIKYRLPYVIPFPQSQAKFIRDRQGTC